MSRFSVSFYIRTAICILITCILAVLVQGAFAAWARMATAEKIATVAEASSQMFQALHNLRVDRSNTNRFLVGDAAVPAMSDPQKNARAAEMPALVNAVAALRNVEFPDQAAIIARLEGATQKLRALHEETLAAQQKPKAGPTSPKRFSITSAP